MKVYSQLNPPPHVDEVLETKDLGVLDTTTITKVTDFMQKFASDASFTPPTVDVLFDTDKYDVSVDDDIESIFSDDTSILSDIEELKRARDNS